MPPRKKSSCTTRVMHLVSTLFLATHVDSKSIAYSLSQHFDVLVASNSHEKPPSGATRLPAAASSSVLHFDDILITGATTSHEREDSFATILAHETSHTLPTAKPSPAPTPTPSLAPTPLPTPLPCDAGYYWRPEGVGCTACAPGTYMPTAGQQRSCFDCPGGQYQIQEGETACETCPAGRSCPTGAATTTACGVGVYAPSGAASCTDCPAGRYAKLTKQDTCTSCAAGRYAEGLRTIECAVCSRGRSSPSGGVACTNCSAFFYNPVAGGTCLACPAGQYQLKTGSVSCDTTGAPSRVPTSPPSFQDTVRVAISFNLAASALPSPSDESALKSAAAAASGVSEKGITHFSVTTTQDYRRRLITESSTTSPGNALHSSSSKALEAPTPLLPPSRLLASYTWAVTFDVATSLAATNYSSVAGFQEALLDSFASSTFAAALNSVLETAVVVEDVSGTPTTLLPSPAPTLLPWPAPSPRPSPSPSLQPAVTQVVVVPTSWLSSAGTILGGAVVGAALLTACMRVFRRQQRQFRSKYHVDERFALLRENMFSAILPGARGDGNDGSDSDGYDPRAAGLKLQFPSQKEDEDDDDDDDDEENHHKHIELSRTPKKAPTSAELLRANGRRASVGGRLLAAVSSSNQSKNSTGAAVDNFEGFTDASQCSPPPSLLAADLGLSPTPTSPSTSSSSQLLPFAESSTGGLYKGHYSPFGAVACKRLPTLGLSSAEKKRLDRDVAALAKLQHPNVLRVFGVCADAQLTFAKPVDYTAEAAVRKEALKAAAEVVAVARAMVPHVRAKQEALEANLIAAEKADQEAIAAVEAAAAQRVEDSDLLGDETPEEQSLRGAKETFEASIREAAINGARSAVIEGAPLVAAAEAAVGEAEAGFEALKIAHAKVEKRHAREMKRIARAEAKAKEAAATEGNLLGPDPSATLGEGEDKADDDEDDDSEDAAPVVEGALVLVSELCLGGTLRAYYAVDSLFTTEMAIRVSSEVLSGLAALHANGISHGDLRCHKVLLEPGTFTAKLSGLVLGRRQPSSLGLELSMRYWAPEVHKLFRKSGAGLRAEAEEAELKAQKLVKSVVKLEAEHARKVKAVEEAAAKAKIFKAELAKAAVQFTQSSLDEEDGADVLKKPSKKVTQEMEEDKKGKGAKEKVGEEVDTEKDTETDDAKGDAEVEKVVPQEDKKKTQVEKYMASIRADLAEDRDVDKELLCALPREALETLLALPEEELSNENRGVVEEFAKALKEREAARAAARLEREKARADAIRETEELEAAEAKFVEELWQEATAAAEAVVRRQAKAQAAEAFAKTKWEEVKRINAPLGPGVECGKSIGFWQAADVYNAGLLLWELWFRCAPYGDVSDPFQVGAVVCEGARPPLLAGLSQTGTDSVEGGTHDSANNGNHDGADDDDDGRPFTPPGARAGDVARPPPPPQLRALLEAMWHPDPFLRPSADFAAKCVLQGCSPTDLDPGFGHDKRTAKGRLAARKAESAAKAAAIEAKKRGTSNLGAGASAGRILTGRQASVDLTDRLGRSSLSHLDSGSLRQAPRNAASLRPSPFEGGKPPSTQRMTLLPSWTPDYHALNLSADDDNGFNQEDSGPAEVELDPTIEALLGRLGMAVPARRASAMPEMAMPATQGSALNDTRGATHNGNNYGSSEEDKGGTSGPAAVATGDLLQLGNDANQDAGTPAPAQPPAMNFEGMDPETVALLTRFNFRGAATMANRPGTATPPLPPPPQPTTTATSTTPPLLPPPPSDSKQEERGAGLAAASIAPSDDKFKAGSNGGGNGGAEGSSAPLEPARTRADLDSAAPSSRAPSFPPLPTTLPVLPPSPMSSSEPLPPPPSTTTPRSAASFMSPPPLEAERAEAMPPLPKSPSPPAVKNTAPHAGASAVKEGPCEVAGVDNEKDSRSRSRSRRLLAYTARWVPTTGVLELLSADTGAVMKSFNVKVGSALDRGKAGPLGRKFKVSFDCTDGEPSTTMVVPRDDTSDWVAALNGDNGEELSVFEVPLEDSEVREVPLEETAMSFEEIIENVDGHDREMSFDDL